MKKIATIVSLMLMALILFHFSKQPLENDIEDHLTNDEAYGDLIGQETLKHL